MDLIAYAMSKGYTDDTADGMGAVKGSPCEVDRVEDIDGGKRTVLRWEGKSGNVQTQNLDLDQLAGLTDGYASSDIAFLVNEAAMVAALADELIGQQHLEDSIKNNPSSLPKEAKHTKIGF